MTWFNENATPLQNAKNWISFSKEIDEELNYSRKEERKIAFEKVLPMLDANKEESVLIDEMYKLVVDNRNNNLEEYLIYLNVWKILQGRA